MSAYENGAGIRSRISEESASKSGQIRPEVRIDDRFLYLLQLHGGKIENSFLGEPTRLVGGGGKDEAVGGRRGGGGRGESEGGRGGGGERGGSERNECPPLMEDDDDWIVEISDHPNPFSMAIVDQKPLLAFCGGREQLQDGGGAGMEREARNPMEDIRRANPSEQVDDGNDLDGIVEEDVKCGENINFNDENTLENGTKCSFENGAKCSTIFENGANCSNSLANSANCSQNCDDSANCSSASDGEDVALDLSLIARQNGNNSTVEHLQRLFLLASSNEINRHHSTSISSHPSSGATFGLKANDGFTALPSSGVNSVSKESRSLLIAPFNDKLTCAKEQKGITNSSTAKDQKGKTATVSNTKSKTKGNVIKPYLCRTCGNGFKSYSNLLIHSRIHTGKSRRGTD